MTYPSDTPRQPALRRTDDGNMIPVPLLRAMLSLVLCSLALVSAAVISGHPATGVPAPAAVVQEREIYLIGGGAQAVTVLNADRSVLADLPHGGFITVIQNGLERARTVAHADQTKPIRLVKYANGRFVAEDPTTGWSAELYAFGADNKAAFERLLSD